MSYIPDRLLIDRQTGASFKKRSPKAVKAVVEFAQKAMGTTCVVSVYSFALYSPVSFSDVRIDPKLNQAIWSRGIKSVPHRIRVKLEREYHCYSTLRSSNSSALLPNATLQASVTTTRTRRRSCTPTLPTSRSPPSRV